MHTFINSLGTAAGVFLIAAGASIERNIYVFVGICLLLLVILNTNGKGKI